MFTTSWCGYCAQLKGALTRDGLSFTEVDIEVDPRRAEFVEHVNGGNRTVPTVLFPDGTTATNPSLAEVRERLAG
ncbi:MAG: mycoredoxin [Terracoccus sp.]